MQDNIRNMGNELLNFQKSAILGKVSGEPLCQEYLNEWRKCGDSKEQLMQLALRQQSIPFFVSACDNGVGVSKDYMLSEFGDYMNGRIFYDCDGVSGYSYELLIQSNTGIELCVDVANIMWSKDLFITISKTKAPRIYISNGSDVCLSLDGFNSPAIYLFDNSKVTIDDADDESDVIIYKYSKDANVEIGKYCLANVKVFNKELKL